MISSFKKLLVEEFTYEYKIPSPKMVNSSGAAKMWAGDFYMLQYFYELWSNESKSSFIKNYLGDSDVANIEELLTKDFRKLMDHIREHMLECLFLSICSESKHIMNKTIAYEEPEEQNTYMTPSVQSITKGITDPELKQDIEQKFQGKRRKTIKTDKKERNYDYTNLVKIVEKYMDWEDWLEFIEKSKKRISNPSRNVTYEGGTNSHHGVYEAFIKDANISKDKFVALCRDCFYKLEWSGQVWDDDKEMYVASYGAGNWGKICDGYFRLKDNTPSNSIKNYYIFVDNTYDLVHNTGAAMNKTKAYGDPDWTKEFLDMKANDSGRYEVEKYSSIPPTVIKKLRFLLEKSKSLSDKLLDNFEKNIQNVKDSVKPDMYMKIVMQEYPSKRSSINYNYIHHALELIEPKKHINYFSKKVQASLYRHSVNQKFSEISLDILGMCLHHFNYNSGNLIPEWTDPETYKLIHKKSSKKETGIDLSITVIKKVGIGKDFLLDLARYAMNNYSENQLFEFRNKYDSIDLFDEKISEALFNEFGPEVKKIIPSKYILNYLPKNMDFDDWYEMNKGQIESNIIEALNNNEIDPKTVYYNSNIHKEITDSTIKKLLIHSKINPIEFLENIYDHGKKNDIDEILFDIIS
ncbi:MAG: hypothetical protein ACOC3V_03870, partial [bacterium]